MSSDDYFTHDIFPQQYSDIFIKFFLLNVGTFICLWEFLTTVYLKITCKIPVKTAMIPGQNHLYSYS